MSDIISLRAFDFELDIAPLAGGGIARLDWHALPLLRTAIAGAVVSGDPLGLSCFPMTPYVSRITDGALSWGDVTAQIAPNMAGGLHPLHGIGWRRAWDIIARSDTYVALSLNHPGDADWPWAFVTRQDFTLNPDHVEHRLSISSRDDRPFPTSLGPHPYFNAADATISFVADSLWEISGESLPTHKARPAVVDALATGTSAANLDLDHCFEGWNGSATVAWPSHSLRVEAMCQLDDQTRPCTRLQLYTPPGQDYFCLEPVTARCVAFATADPESHGVVNLQGQTVSIITKFVPHR